MKLNLLTGILVFFFAPFVMGQSDVIYTKVDINPIPVKTPPPVYPLDLKRAGTSGIVVVSIVIDEAGLVTDATVVKSTNVGFEENAVASIKKWKFKPGKVDGTPVKVRVSVPMKFDVNDG